MVERRPGLVASAKESVRTLALMEPPLALLPVGVVKLVTILEPLASFERAIAAEALMSALTISPSRISLLPTAPAAMLPARMVSVAMSPVRIVASRILPVVMAPVPIVRTPALVTVASPEKEP